jgi:hypothetical protein
MTFDDFLKQEKIYSKIEFLKELTSRRENSFETLTYHFMTQKEKTQFKNWHKEIAKKHIEKLKLLTKIDKALYKKCYDIYVHINHIKNDIYFTPEEERELALLQTKWKNEKINALKKEIEDLLKVVE